MAEHDFGSRAVPCLDASALAGLAERVAAATGADRELDCALYKAFGDGALNRGRLGWEWRPDNFGPWRSMPELTASLDAALALFGRAMPGVRWCVRDERFGSITAVVYPPAPPKPPYNLVAACYVEEPVGDGGVYAHAPTPALALLSAMLAALAAGANLSEREGDGSGTKNESRDHA